MAVSGVQGFYSILLTPGKYTIVAAAAGFGTHIVSADLENSVSDDFFLNPIPLNGVIAYAQNPVLQASPGTDTYCTISVFNSQVSAQTVTFSVVAPDEFGAWFPQGEALNIPPGQCYPWTFTFRYTGTQRGSFPIIVRVSDGVNFFDISIIVEVEDTPDQTIDFYANSYYREVTNGSIIHIPLTVQNNYAEGKFLKVYFDYLPEGWKTQTADYTGGLSARTDNNYYIYKNEKYSFILRVFIPSENTSDGIYNIDMHMSGDGVTSNILPIIVQVNNTRLLDAQFLYDNGTPFLNNYTFNVSKNNKSDIGVLVKVRLTNNWNFPVSVDANYWMSANNNQTNSKWNVTFYSENYPDEKAIIIDPGMNETIQFHISPSVNMNDEISTFHIIFDSTDDDTKYVVDVVQRTMNIHIIKTVDNTTPEKNPVEKNVDNNRQFLIIPGILLSLSIILYILYIIMLKFYNRWR